MIFSEIDVPVIQTRIMYSNVCWYLSNSLLLVERKQKCQENIRSINDHDRLFGVRFLAWARRCAGSPPGRPNILSTFRRPPGGTHGEEPAT